MNLVVLNLCVFVPCPHTRMYIYPRTHLYDDLGVCTCVRNSTIRPSLSSEEFTVRILFFTSCLKGPAVLEYSNSFYSPASCRLINSHAFRTYTVVRMGSLTCQLFGVPIRVCRTFPPIILIVLGASDSSRRAEQRGYGWESAISPE